MKGTKMDTNEKRGDMPLASSKVSERMLWLSGKNVKVKLCYAELGQMGSEEFVAAYHDCLPMGAAYFFVFSVGGRRRMVKTTAVLEMAEI